MIVVVTGKLGSGKTTLTKAFGKHQAHTIYTDQLAHQVITRSRIKSRLVSLFGKRILRGNHRISRKKLGNIVFNDPPQLRRLNSVIHPPLKREIRKYLNKRRLNVIDAALYYELGLDQMADKTVLVKAKPGQVMRRLGGYYYPRTAIRKIRRMQSLPKHPDYIVYNNSTRAALERKARKILSSIKSQQGV